MDNSHMRIFTKCQPQPKLPSFFLSLAMADCIFKLYHLPFSRGGVSGAAWKFQEGGVKKFIFQENFSPNYSFPGVCCEKNGNSWGGVFYEAGNSRGGSLTHKWKFQGSSIPPGRFKIAISQFEGGYNSLFNSLLIFCFFIAVEHFDGPKRKICFL